MAKAKKLLAVVVDGIRYDADYGTEFYYENEVMENPPGDSAFRSYFATGRRRISWNGTIIVGPGSDSYGWRNEDAWPEFIYEERVPWEGDHYAHGPEIVKVEGDE